MTVTTRREGAVAIVTIDNPPVNATSHAVRAGLMAALAEVEADAGLRAAVLACAGRTFVAGADVTEFDAPPRAPLLPEVIAAIEAASKPWVAALHGSVLGGGLELALGCALRVATAETKLGLPEVTLGLIPGAGGTVRLPRLVGAEAALDMIAGGRPLAAGRAAELGLVDATVEGGAEAALATALELARSLTAAPLPLLDRPAPVIQDREAWASATAAVRRRARGARAPGEAVAAVERALELPAREALDAERATFLDLKSDPQSAALRYIFFAERSAGKLPALKDVAPRPLARIGVVGGGTMGAGIAAACLLAGLEVTMIERDEAARDAGASRIAAILDDSLRRGKITTARRAALGAAFAAATEYSALAEADLVIEAVFEEMEVKRAVFADLDRHCRPDAVLASNTSYLDVKALAAGTERPERVLGLHFFSPAHVMKLLEVVIPDTAAPDVQATGFALARRLGKIAVPAGVCDGFIGNRIMSAYRRECEFMLEDGAMPWQIDAAMRDFGFPMGLFEMQDLAGLDISWAMRKRQAATRDAAARYVDLGDRLCEAGRFGRKTGAGWYDYDSGRAEPSAFVEALVRTAQERRDGPPADFDAGTILHRILDSMAREGRAILDEGIADRAEDIDVVMTNGYGFPRWKGGPMWLAGRRADI